MKKTWTAPTQVGTSFEPRADNNKKEKSPQHQLIEQLLNVYNLGFVFKYMQNNFDHIKVIISQFFEQDIDKNIFKLKGIFLSAIKEDLTTIQQDSSFIKCQIVVIGYCMALACSTNFNDSERAAIIARAARNLAVISKPAKDIINGFLKNSSDSSHEENTFPSLHQCS